MRMPVPTSDQAVTCTVVLRRTAPTSRSSRVCVASHERLTHGASSNERRSLAARASVAASARPSPRSTSGSRTDLASQARRYKRRRDQAEEDGDVDERGDRALRLGSEPDEFRLLEDPQRPPERDLRHPAAPQDHRRPIADLAPESRGDGVRDGSDQQDPAQPCHEDGHRRRRRADGRRGQEDQTCGRESERDLQHQVDRHARAELGRKGSDLTTPARMPRHLLILVQTDGARRGCPRVRGIDDRPPGRWRRTTPSSAVPDRRCGT